MKIDAFLQLGEIVLTSVKSVSGKDCTLVVIDGMTQVISCKQFFRSKPIAYVTHGHTYSNTDSYVIVINDRLFGGLRPHLKGIECARQIKGQVMENVNLSRLNPTTVSLPL